MRAARDYAAADAVRARLREAGWEVADTPAGADLRQAVPPPVATCLAVVQGWPEDAERWLGSLGRHLTGRWEALLVDISGDRDASQRLGRLEGARLVAGDPEAGFGAAVNAGVAAAEADVVVLFDTSVEATGDLLRPLLAALSGEGVVLAGPFGLRGDPSLREFEPAAGPEVEAVEGYCMAFRRRDFDAAGRFDAGFHFYRIGDIDLSFRLRGHGGGRAVVVPGLPLVKHAHRMWEATPPEERERLSRRNLYRFLDRWRDRADLRLP